jgi:hypothetical protein
VREYHRNTHRETRRYRGISSTSPINAAKEAVSVIDLADRLAGPGGMRKIGEKWVGRCPLPDHEDRTPSFTVYPGRWHCYGCGRGGDVVDLARLAWRYDERDAHVAAANVLYAFGCDIPQRPPSWFRKQERQRPVRDGLEEIKVRALRRALYRMVDPLIVDDEDAEKTWNECLPLARLWLQRINDERKAS